MINSHDCIICIVYFWYSLSCSNYFEELRSVMNTEFYIVIWSLKICWSIRCEYVRTRILTGGKLRLHKERLRLSIYFRNRTLRTYISCVLLYISSRLFSSTAIENCINKRLRLFIYIQKLNFVKLLFIVFLLYVISLHFSSITIEIFVLTRDWDSSCISEIELCKNTLHAFCCIYLSFSSYTSLDKIKICINSVGSWNWPILA